LPKGLEHLQNSGANAGNGVRNRHQKMEEGKSGGGVNIFVFRMPRKVIVVGQRRKILNVEKGKVGEKDLFQGG